MKTNFKSLIKALFGVMLVSVLVSCNCEPSVEETPVQDSTEVLNDTSINSLSVDSMYLDSTNVEEIVD